jgi:manganese/iron transport system permease protein
MSSLAQWCCSTTRIILTPVPDASMLDLLLEPLSLGFMQRALLASVLVGALTAMVGTYVVLKGLAFIGDAIAHAAFPGVVIAFMLQLPIYPAAIAAALVTALGIGWVSRRAAIRLDTAIGVVFAGAFAAGVLLMSTLKGYVGDLMSFLFGNVLAVTVGDLIVVASLTVVVILALLATFKELLFATFDPLGAQAAGYPVNLLEYGLLAMVALAIAVSIQVVGIILVVAMLVTPAATAQLLTNRFQRLMLLAVVLSIVESVVGLYLSFYGNWASGATIVLVQTAVFAVVVVVSRRSRALRI